MKEKTWRYITLMLSTVTIMLFAFSVLAPMTFQKDENSFYTSMVTPVGSVGQSSSSTIKGTDCLITITPADFDPDDLDQYWLLYNYMYPIGPMWYAQSFANTRPVMLGFSVLISRTHALPEEPLVLGLIDHDLLSGSELNDVNNWVISGTLSPTDIPGETWYWITFEFDTPVTIPTPIPHYHIIYASNDGDIDGSFWRVAFNTGGGYQRGQLYLYNRNEQEWTPSVMYDACFKTYTVDAPPPPPDPPSIHISVTSTISMQLGFIALIGVALSGSKYYFSFIR